MNLQLIRMTRWCRAAGIHPAVACILGFILFVAFVELGYYKSSWAPWILVVVASVLISRLSLKQRDLQLQLIFGRKRKLQLRVAENTICAIPVAAMLMMHGDFQQALSVVGLAFVLAFYIEPRFTRHAVPTPFGRHPFEFPSGFRRTFPLLLGAYALIVTAVIANNVNLGIFAILVIYLVVLTYYRFAEPLFFVWIHSDGSVGFLRRKLRTAISLSTSIALLPALVLVVTFPSDSWLVVVAILIGIGYAMTGILSKYAYYPSELPIAPGLVISLSILIPPLMLITLPVLYKRAVRTLRPHLL